MAIGTANPRLWRQFDWVMFLAAVALLGFSLACIDSVTHNTALHRDFTQQLEMVIPALGTILLVAAYGYEWLRSSAKYIYIVNIVALAAVIVVGHSALGAQRWISLAGFRFQPSEFAKLALIVTLAKVLSDKNVHAPDGVITVLATVAVPAILIFKQPDLGTALVYGAIALGMLYWAGLSPAAIFNMLSPVVSMIVFALGLWWWIAYMFGLAVFLLWSRRHHWLVPISLGGLNLLTGIATHKVWGMLKPYQKQRILTFLNPNSDPLGAGYHVIQSKIAIGSGGLLGEGLFHGTQTQLHFIPEQHTDFIFSVVGEELGFIGAIVLLALYAILIGRGIVIANRAKDPFASLLAIGVVTMLLFHVFVNVGMATGLMPVVGIPLPLMSFGRTSLLTDVIAIGLLEAIAMRQKKLMF